MDNIKILKLVSCILYPKYNPYLFIFYMYIRYHGVFKRNILYKIKTISDDVLWDFLSKNTYSSQDINNCVLLHPRTVYKNDKLLEIYHSNSKKSRRVFIVTDNQCEKNTIYLTTTLFSNYSTMINNTTLNAVQLLEPINMPINFAVELKLSLISTPYNISNALIDTALANYFKLPKLIYVNDIIKINVKKFASNYFYCDLKANCVDCLYFNCNQILINNHHHHQIVSAATEGCLCLIGKTAIKQTANIQRFIPLSSHRDLYVESSANEFDFLKIYQEIYDALHGVFASRQNSLLSSNQLQLKPIFLVQGEDGCGDDLLLETVAGQFGMHYYRVNNSELTANVYAQYESKLNNMFFNAKCAAPCLVCLQSFQDFGKNNEGQYDERLINSFINYVDNVFSTTSKFPIIIICCSNTREIPAELKRIFLEIFEINAPDTDERVAILKWLIQRKRSATKPNQANCDKINFTDLANRTHGFYYKDLEAVLYYAEINSYRANDNEINNNHFQQAIDFMQKNYNESIGAPKVPQIQWSDIGGLNDIKQEIINTINLPLKYPALFSSSSGLTRSGILLYGPPGTGKTLLAKAVATECSLCFLTVKGPELLNMYVGQSEHNVRDVFEKARQASPCIIFFDELDSLAPNRGLSGDSGGVMDRVVSQLLAEMDGLETNGKLFIIGATNRPDLIDPALLRPGRFDKLLYVPPCKDNESKISVLKALTRRCTLAENLDFTQIVNRCPSDMTGADFYGICSNSWSLAAKRLIQNIEKDQLNVDDFNENNVIITTEDFELALKTFKPSISSADLAYFENLQEKL